MRRFRTSLPPSRFRDRQRGEFEITRGAEAFGRPLQHLFRGGGLADGRQRQRRHDDGQSDSGAAPEQLLHEHRQRQARRIADQVAIEERAVKAPQGRFFEHRPRELLPLVIFGGDRPDDLFGELVCAAGQVMLRRGGGDIKCHDVWSTHCRSRRTFMRTSVGWLTGSRYPLLRLGRRDPQPSGENGGRIKPWRGRGVGGHHPSEQPLLGGRQPFLPGVEPAQSSVEFRPCQGRAPTARRFLCRRRAGDLRASADNRPLDVLSGNQYRTHVRYRTPAHRQAGRSRETPQPKTNRPHKLVRPIAGTDFRRNAMSGNGAVANACPVLFPTQHAMSTYAVFEMMVVLMELPPLESSVAWVCPWRTPSTVQLASGAVPVRLTMT